MNAGSDAVGAYRPTIGRKTRAFEMVWQVVRYEVGYSAQQLGLEGSSYNDRFYALGGADAENDARRQTLDDLLIGCCQ